MGLYQQLNKKNNDKQIIEYEEIIKNINYFYEMYKNYHKNSDVTCFSMINNQIKFIDKLLLDNKDPRYSILQEKKKEILSKNIDSKLKLIEYYREINELCPTITSDPYISSYIFEAVSSMMPKYSSIKNVINSKVEEYVFSGIKKYEAINRALQEKNISINIDSVLNDIESETKEDQFVRVTNRLKETYQREVSKGRDSDEVLKELLPEAYGIVKAACSSVLSITPYDVQLMGAIALNEGKITEMYTGEGKTITAILPAYLNALTGREVDIFTPNDYLAERDFENNRKVFEVLGLSVGFVKSHNASINEKQKAYRCDVVYGPSSAFAWDYLRDASAKTVDEFLQRQEKPGFVIVDEADQILINNACNPYTLSGGNGTLTKEEKAEDRKIKQNLEFAYLVSKVLSTDVKTVTQKDKYQDRLEIEYKEGKDNESYIVVFKSSDNDSDFYITKRGYIEIFRMGMKDKIDELTLKAESFFINNSSYIEGKDYIMENGRLILTTTGLDRATNEIDEYFDLRTVWYTEEKYLVMQKYINNAIISEFLMTKGNDNDYIVAEDKEGKRIIQPLQTARAVEGNKYRDGIQEALMLKEGIPIEIGNGERLIDTDSGSISNRGLLYRYAKRSGMTGTSDKSAFREIYGLDTFSVPRNKTYMYENYPISVERPTERDDKPMKLYKTEEQKLNGIIKDIEESHKKGQPVLVLVDSISDAEKLATLIKINGMDTNLLTAKSDMVSEKEEARIISEAGRLGAITVATEMAGRGTDIKLGGDFDYNSAVKEMLIEKSITKIMNEIKIGLDQNLSLLERQMIIIEEEKKLYEENVEVLKKVYDKQKTAYDNDKTYKNLIDKEVKDKRDKELETLKSVGGLNYIQTKPFITRRNDDQGKGRVGRQGEVGSTRIYVDAESIKDSEDKKTLIDLLGDREVIDDVEAEGLISEIVEKNQSEIEYMMDMQILQSDTMDLAMSSYSTRFYNFKKNITKTNDLETAIRNMTYLMIETSIKENVNPKKKKKVDKNKTRLTRLNLNMDNLLEEINGTFGIKIGSSEILERCTDVGDLKNFIFDIVNELRKEKEVGFSREHLNKKYKDVLINNSNQSYNKFMDSIVDVQNQMINDQLAQNNSHNRLKELDDIYSVCQTEGFKESLREIYKVKTQKKEDTYSTEIKPVEEIPSLSPERVSIYDESLVRKR